MISHLPLKAKHFLNAKMPSDPVRNALVEILPYCVFNIGSDCIMIYCGGRYDAVHLQEPFSLDEFVTYFTVAKHSAFDDTILCALWFDDPYIAPGEDIEEKICTRCNGTGEGATPDLPCPECQKRRK